MSNYDDDVRTATADLRDLLTAHGADPDALLPLFRAEWEWGVRYNFDPNQPDAVHWCDDQDRAREWGRSLSQGPVVRRLRVWHVGSWQEIPAPKETEQQ